ncbi:MAG: hypothetical protein K0R18_140 [Bacillales bacterium]|jgi:uncharacterized metal-binding protein|nr:hypothetical protein [Bacillales bacterium]
MAKVNWLDKFAADQHAKEQMKKQASTNKVANQIIVSPEDVPGAQEGSEVQFNGESFKVVDANFSDEVGPGVVLEKAAGYEGLEGDPMAVSMGTQPSSVSTPSSTGQTYHRTKLDIQQTYDNDQDAQYGQSSAQATEQMIAGENATDRTSVPGHYTNSPGLNTAPAAPIGAPAGGPVGAPTPVGTPAPSATPVVPAATPAPVGTDAPAAPAAPAAVDVPAEEVAVEDAPVDGVEEEKENKILSALKNSMPKKAKVTRASINSHIINLANDVSSTITAEVEEVLEDAEEAVKAFVPARLASAALAKLEEALEEEGIEALFDKMVSKEAISKTAGEEVSDEEIEEVVKKVAEVVVAELEEVLKDADEAMDGERETLAEGEEDGGFEMEAKLKAMVERKLHAKGIYTRFARTASKPAKKSIAQKIRDARRSN